MTGTMRLIQTLSRALSSLLIVSALSATIWLPWAVPARSATDCDRPGTAAEASECAGIRLRDAEREMGELYARLLQSDDRDMVEALKGAQEAWMRWREAEGRLAARMANDPAQAGAAALTQQAQMTEDRVKDLRAMLGD